MNIALSPVVTKQFLTPDAVLREQARLLSLENQVATRVVHSHIEVLCEDGEWKEVKIK